MFLKTGDRIHLKNPEYPDKRVLHSGQTVAIEGDHVEATFETPRFDVAPEAEFIVFYEAKRKFVQQAARIEAVETLENDPALAEAPATGIRVRLELVGDTAPADGREHYRVTTLSTAITASFGAESDCKVVDVSSTGFALLSQQECQIGETLPAELRHAGENYSGTVVVQSIQQRRDGTRYGVRYVKKRDVPCQFEEGLNLVCMAVQREQLARQGGEGGEAGES